VLTAGELAGMRQAALRALPGLCTIQSVTRTADGQGGWTEAWVSAATNVPCKLSATAIRMEGQSTGAQFVVRTGWKLAVPYDQAISTSNRVVFGGDTYEVLSVEDAQEYRATRRAYLRRID
jgi:head-tail adaptor